MNSRWSVYFKERFPLIPNLLVAAGIVESARRWSLVQGNQPAGFIPFLTALVGGMLFLMQLRLMDETKDFEKDKIAHPERPLPRGLFRIEEFKTFVRRFQWAMILWTGAAAFAGGIPAALLFGFGVLYLHLMFVEFYLGDRLARRPLLYAILHQIIIYPLGGFVLACFQVSWRDPRAFWFCTLLIGAFFGFEVGRKLDPHAHPVLRTYLLQYGREKTVFLLLVLLGIATHAARTLGAGSILGPLYLVILTGSSLLWWAPAKFKVVEGLVTLYLLLALWSLPLQQLIGGISS
jgi:4-hydroxybenzoate polyprenyltransferase